MSANMGLQLHGEFDAAVWTDAWLATIAEHPDIPTDWGTMVGWFANAIMAGYDHARNDAKEVRDEVLRQVLYDDPTYVPTVGTSPLALIPCEGCGHPYRDHRRNGACLAQIPSTEVMRVGTAVARNLNVEICPCSDFAALSDASPPFVCPCRVCPTCGAVEEDPEMGSHPEDGLAGPCPTGHAAEWWSVCGPYMDGRCPRDAVELAEWSAHDDAILRSNAVDSTDS